MSAWQSTVQTQWVSSQAGPPAHHAATLPAAGLQAACQTDGPAAEEARRALSMAEFSLVPDNLMV